MGGERPPDEVVLTWRAIRDALPSRVALVAVSKDQPLDAVRALHAAGCRDFGERRADELVARKALLPDARWHFIGNVQRNKLKLIREAALVHSFDRPDLAASWQGPPVLLQVHMGGGEHRNGVPPGEVEAALRALDAAGVECRGLSVLPPDAGDAEAARPCFRRLRETRDALLPRWPALRELSMGMSRDWRVAVEEGATMVRVGRAIFG